MHKINGFSLIEVLVTASLLSILLLTIAKMHLSAQLLNSQSMKLNLSLIQLKNAAAILHSDMPELIADWEKENLKLLPRCEGKIVADGDQFIITMQCFTGVNWFWHCNHAAIDQYSCVELRGLKSKGW